ncbi:MAG: hypothetical protein ABJB74_13105 [Gemmatimonas sp.]
MRWKAFAGLLVVFASGCHLAGPPDAEGLRQGQYRVQFDVAAGTGVPSVVVGHHDFTFQVVEPSTFKVSFRLVSAILGSNSFYLNSDLNETIPGDAEWTISWRLAQNDDYRVSVVMREEGAGQYSVPSGCHIFNQANTVDYVGTGCLVQRADTKGTN